MNSRHLNYIILHDGSFYRVFERLGKNVPFEAYNPSRHLGIGDTITECLGDTSVNLWEIEDKPYEVVFND